MNKQELIEELECIEVSTDSLDYLKGADYANERAINLTKQLDEPIKVVVPKFVAEWLDKHKYSTDIIDLFLSVEYATDSDGFVAEKWDYSGKFYDWLSNSADIQFTLCDAMRYGYEVEKEQLYYVKLPGVGYLNNADGGIKHTEKEIKAIDKRYWPFAVKVEG
ncbi:RNA-binding protein [Enterococcus faecalis PF3]|nr:RNA-binding protein [Enterococcus faecalis PF3]